jgi:hypothetical protein
MNELRDYWRPQKDYRLSSRINGLRFQLGRIWRKTYQCVPGRTSNFFAPSTAPRAINSSDGNV